MHGWLQYFLNAFMICHTNSCESYTRHRTGQVLSHHSTLEMRRIAIMEGEYGASVVSWLETSFHHFVIFQKGTYID